MSRYLLTPRAQHDLQEIVQWYSKHRSNDAARKTLRDIRLQLQQLAQHPELGHVEEDLASRDHLFWPHRQFLIVYLRNTEPLQIVTIWDARRGAPEFA